MGQAPPTAVTCKGTFPAAQQGEQEQTRAGPRTGGFDSAAAPQRSGAAALRSPRSRPSATDACLGVSLNPDFPPWLG